MTDLMTERTATRATTRWLYRCKACWKQIVIVVQDGVEPVDHRDLFAGGHRCEKQTLRARRAREAAAKAVSDAAV